MIYFISLASIIRPRAWHWRKRPSRRLFVSAQMRAKHTLRERKIFIEDISIMTALWLNWNLPQPDPAQ